MQGKINAGGQKVSPQRSWLLQLAKAVGCALGAMFKLEGGLGQDRCQGRQGGEDKSKWWWAGETGC